MSVMERVEPRTRYTGTENIVLPAGYHIEAVATGLNYPTSVAWDDDGRLLIAESTVPFGKVAPTPIRIVRMGPNGTLETVITGLEHLINDIKVHHGRLYISQQGKLSMVEDGQIHDLLTGLPSWGLHQNNAFDFGPDGRLYFCQGTVSNAGVVDTFTLDHLQRAGHLYDHDTPGAPVVLTGRNYDTTDLSGKETRTTGAYSSWGTPTSPGQRIEGPAPGQAANGAVMSANSGGSDLRVFAWGLRNPYGLAFAPDGRLYATNNGANRVPPRQISGDPDTLWRIEEGTWYGWPDFYAGQPVTDPAFKPPSAARNDFLIANHAELLKGRDLPPPPVLSFGLHAAATKFDFCRQPEFGFAGQMFLAEFGSLLTPVEGLRMTGAEGHRVVRVDLEEKRISSFAFNRTGVPASKSGERGGLERPIAASFGPDGNLYIVDFGVLELRPGGWVADAGTGMVWRVTHTGE